MTTIQNPTGPSLLNNNDVFSFIDFRSTAIGMTALNGTTITIGDVVYTAGSNWLPKFFDGVTNIDPIELASSLVEAVNGTYENAPNKSVLTDTIGRANSLASAYHTDGIVHLVKRTSAVPTVATDIPGVPTPVPVPTPSPSGSPTISRFLSGSASETEGDIAAPYNCQFFEVENLSATTSLFIIDDSDLSTFELKPLMGTKLYGGTGNYKVYTLGAGTSANYQLKLNF